MPVMKARRDDEFAQAAKGPADVGVDEGGVEIDVEDIELQRRFLATEGPGEYTKV